MWSDLTADPFQPELPSKPMFLSLSSLSPVLAIGVPLEALGHPLAGEQSPLSSLTRGQQQGQQQQGKQPSSSHPAKL